jgi:hypothetical protein
MNGLVGEQLERSFGSSAGGMTLAKTRFLTSPKIHSRRVQRVQQNPFSVILNHVSGISAKKQSTYSA